MYDWLERQYQRREDTAYNRIRELEAALAKAEADMDEMSQSVDENIAVRQKAEAERDEAVGCVAEMFETMNMQEGRMSEHFHITAESAKALWDQAKARAWAILGGGK
jgi:anaerobic ribonucleoside-triphosphate reductase